MAWETRNGRRFFYISQRDGGQVRKIYVGSGDVGRAAELALECRREQQQRVRDWLHLATTKFAELDAIDGELAVGLAAILYAECGILLNARAARRILRRKENAVTEGPVGEPTLPSEDHATWLQLRERASRGDREAAALLPFLEQHPELRDRLGDLSQLSLSGWLDLVAGSDDAAKGSRHAKVRQLAESLRRDTTDPLEELLAWRVGRLWLQKRYFDLQLAAAMCRTTREQEFLAKRQRATAEAHMAAIQALRDDQDRRTGLQSTTQVPSRSDALKRSPE